MPCQRALLLPQQLWVNLLPCHCRSVLLIPCSSHPNTLPLRCSRKSVTGCPMAAGHQVGLPLGLAAATSLLFALNGPSQSGTRRAGLLATAIGTQAHLSLVPMRPFLHQWANPVAEASVATTFGSWSRGYGLVNDRAGHLMQLRPTLLQPQFS